MDPLVARLDRIEAKLDAVLNKPLPEFIGLDQIMLLTGTNSRTAVYRWLEEQEIKPYLRGKYRRIDVTNRVQEIILFHSEALDPHRPEDAVIPDKRARPNTLPPSRINKSTTNDNA